MNRPDPPATPRKPPDPERVAGLGWRDFSPRRTLNNHPSAVAICAVVLLLLALGIILRSNQVPQRPPLRAYYFDLNTQQVFVDRAGRRVPFKRGRGLYEYPDGPDGSAVRATIYTCGDPRDVRAGMNPAQLREVGATIVTLHRLSPQALARQREYRAAEDAEAPAFGDYLPHSGELISDAAGLEWVTPESEAGRVLTASVVDACGSDASPRVCVP